MSPAAVSAQMATREPREKAFPTLQRALSRAEDRDTDVVSAALSAVNWRLGILESASRSCARTPLRTNPAVGLRVGLHRRLDAL